MNEKMIEKLVVTDTKPTYESLKSKEKELLAQLHELKEEIANAEKDIINKKLDTAIRCLTEVDEMTNRFYRCSIEAYCEECEEEMDIDIDLTEIIEALEQIR